MCCSRPLQCELHFLVGLLPLVFGLKGMFDVMLVWSLRETGARYGLFGMWKAVAEYGAVCVGGI
jgi:hypothetical protein